MKITMLSDKQAAILLLRGWQLALAVYGSLFPALALQISCVIVPIGQ